MSSGNNKLSLLYRDSKVRTTLIIQGRGQVSERVDPAQAAFEINALMIAANMAFQLHGDCSAFDRARAGIERSLTAN